MSVLKEKVLWCERCQEWPEEHYIIQGGDRWFHQKCGQWLEEKETMKSVFLTTKLDDPVNHPKHYTFGRFEVIDVIQDWKLDFLLANTIKYIARSEHKGKELEDLKKARWYLDRKIQQLEKA